MNSTADTVDGNINAGTKNNDGAKDNLKPLLSPWMSPDQNESVMGMLCNDPNGLCLDAKGTMNGTDDAVAGVYTSLTRLASQLQSASSEGNNSSVQPLITLEMDNSAILVKEYDGHAVAVQVPMEKAQSSSTTDPSSSDSN